MRVLLSAMGRAVLLAGLPAFVVLVKGVWIAPNYGEARALAGATSIAIAVAAVRALFVFVPVLSEKLVEFLHVPLSYEHVVIGVVVTAIGGFLSTTLSFLTAPTLDAAKAAGIAGLLALGSALTSTVMGAFTPGLGPFPGRGFDVPPQPVPAAALPVPRDPTPVAGVPPQP